MKHTIYKSSLRLNPSKEHMQSSSMYNLQPQWQLNMFPSSNEHWQPPINPFTGLPQWPLNPANYMLSGGPAPGQGFYGGPSMSGPSGGGFYSGPPAPSCYSGQQGTSLYGGPSSYSTSSGPVLFQGMSPNHWQHLQNQYHPPPKPKRRKKRSRKPVHPHLNNHKPESPGAIYYDRSTGVYRTYSPNDASHNTRIGKVWETPTKKPIHG